jgi:putative restriction endonuclease
MKIWVGVTDKNWFDMLMKLGPEDVNFWQPSGNRQFKVLKPGELFLFKLHSPLNFIVGGGHFVSYSQLPSSLAWEAFGTSNGVQSLSELRQRVLKYRGGTSEPDPTIGCNVLAEPFFLPREDWIPIPASWAPNIVQGKTYDTATDEGRQLHEALQAVWKTSPAAVPTAVQEPAIDQVEDDGPRFGNEYLTRGRLGQGSFRVLVTDAYQRRCAVTGEKTLPVLEAAHIKPYAEDGPHRVTNGLLLRSDLHRLFDRGYVTVTPELRLEVSSKLKEHFSNGKEYYAHHGKPLAVLPDNALLRPNAAFLLWHNKERYLG